MKGQGLNQTIVLSVSFLDRVLHFGKRNIAFITAFSAPVRGNTEIDVMVPLSNHSGSTVVIVCASDDSPVDLAN